MTGGQDEVFRELYRHRDPVLALAWVTELAGT